MSLPARIFASVTMVLGAAGCDRALTTAPAPVHAEDRVLLEMLEGAGYRGPVMAGTRVSTDDRGAAPATRALFLTESGRELLQRRDNRAVAQSLRTAVLATEVTSPDEIDARHNAPQTQIGYLVNPSRLNGRNSHQSTVEYTNLRFANYDDATGDWYIVPAGVVLETRVQARDSTGGHWHGSDTTQRRLRKRVGYVTPATGSFATYWNFTWFVPEFAGDVWITHRLREIGGPNDGDENWFFPFEPDAARISGLVRLPENTALYLRQGGTDPHPEAFNDWGTQDMIGRITAVARAYNIQTRALARINDIGLFFGGRFDVGENTPTGFVRCSDVNPSVCWDYSHKEHRTGTEVDMNPERGAPLANRAAFRATVKRGFVTILVHPDHLHARASGSPYN